MARLVNYLVPKQSLITILFISLVLLALGVVTIVEPLLFVLITASLLGSRLIFKSLQNPKNSLIFLLFCSPYARLPYIPWNLHYFKHGILSAYFLSLLVYAIVKKKQFLPLPKDKLVRFIVVLPFFFVFGILQADFSFGLLTSYFLPGIFLLSVLSLVDKIGYIRQLIQVYIYAILVQSIYIIASYFGLIEFTWGPNIWIGRPTYMDSFTGAMIYIHSLAGVIPLSLGMVAENSKSNKKVALFWAGVTLFLILSQYLSLEVMRFHGRSGLLATFVSVGVFFLLHSKKMLVVYGIGFIVLILRNLSWIQNNLRVNQLSVSSLFDSRIDVYAAAWDIFLDNFMIGVGFDNYDNVFFYYSNLLQNTSAPSGAHNLYLTMAAEAGFIAAIAVIVFMVLILWKGYKIVQILRSSPFGNLAITLYSSLVSIIIISFFEDVPFVFYGFLAWWLWLASLLRLPSLLQKSLNSRSKIALTVN